MPLFMMKQENMTQRVHILLKKLVRFPSSRYKKGKNDQKCLHFKLSLFMIKGFSAKRKKRKCHAKALHLIEKVVLKEPFEGPFTHIQQHR